MEQYTIVFHHKVIELEYKNCWKQIVDFLYQKWIEKPSDLNHLLCLSTEIWYILIQIDRMELDFLNADISEIELKHKLKQITKFALEHFRTNILVNAYFGYMIKVMPYLFFNYNSDYDWWQTKGLNMIEYAYSLNPNHLLAKAIYYQQDMVQNRTNYYNACEELWLNISPQDWGMSRVNRYFFHILWGNLFYP